jgi:hypothetical protein
LQRAEVMLTTAQIAMALDGFTDLVIADVTACIVLAYRRQRLR